MVEGRVLVQATVTAIGDEHFLYPCCRQCCSKMLVDMINNRWRCLKCNIWCSAVDLEWRYRIRMTVVDTHEYRQISVFGKTLQPYFGTSANTFNRFLSHLNVTHPDTADTALRQAVEMAFVGNIYFFGFPSANDCLDNITVSTLSMAMHRKGDNSDIVAVQMISPDHSQVSTVSECISYLLKKNLSCSFKQTFSQADSFIANTDRRESFKSNSGSILDISENDNQYVNNLVSILFSCENSLSNSTTSMCKSMTSIQPNVWASNEDHEDCTEMAVECPEDTSDSDTMREEGSRMEYTPSQTQKSENLNHNFSASYDLEDAHADTSVSHGPREDGDFDADTFNNSSLILADVGNSAHCPRASPVAVSPVEVLRQESVSFDLKPGGLYCSLRVQEEAGDETSRNMWKPSDELPGLVFKVFNQDLPKTCDFEEMPYSEDLDEFLLKTTRTKTTEALPNGESVSCGVRSHDRRSSSVSKINFLKHPPENVRNMIKFRLGDSYRSENMNSNVRLGAEMVKTFECDDLEVEGSCDLNQTEQKPEETSPKLLDHHVITDIVPEHGEGSGSLCTVDTKLTLKDKCAFECGESGIWEELPESEDFELFLQRAENQMDQPYVNDLGSLPCQLPMNTSQDCASLNTIDSKKTSEQTPVQGIRLMPVNLGKHGSVADLTDHKASHPIFNGGASEIAASVVFNGGASEIAASVGRGTESISRRLSLDPAFNGSMELFDASGDLFDEADDYQWSEKAGRSPFRKDASLVLESVDESVYCPSVLETPGDGSVEHKKQVKFAKRLSHISSVQLIDIRMKLTFGVALESPSSPGRSCLRRSLVRLRRSSVSGDGHYRTGKEIFPPHCTAISRRESHNQDNSDNPMSCQLDQSFQISSSHTDARPDSGVCLQSQDLFLPSPDLFSPLSPGMTQSSPSRGVAIAQSVSQDITEAENAPQQNRSNPVQKPCGPPSTAVLELRPPCHRSTENSATQSNIRTCVFPGDHFDNSRIVSQTSSNGIDVDGSELHNKRKSEVVHHVSLDDSDSGVAHSVLKPTGIVGDGDCDRSVLLFSQFDRTTTDAECLSNSTPPASCCLEGVSELTPDLFDSP